MSRPSLPTPYLPTMVRRPLTRRDFLLRLGAAGGSGLAMSAMSAWDLMAAPAGPKPAFAEPPNRNARVLVLGAGVSGLTAGYELGKLGYDYQVLEARDRVGGVNWSVRRGDVLDETGGERQLCDFDEGQYFNAGPWRIPEGHRAVLDYCRELNVPLEWFINENEAGYLYFEGEEMGALSGQRVRLRDARADLRGYTSELLAKVADQGSLDRPLTREDRDSLVEYLVRDGRLDAEDRVYSGYRTDSNPTDPHDFAALLQWGFGTRFRQMGAVTFGHTGAFFQPVGGMDRIPHAFAQAMAPRVTLGAEVRSILLLEDEVQVVVRHRATGEEERLTADFCISCLPLSILKELDVNLSPEMAQVVVDVSYSNSAKMGLQMKRRFWEEDDGIYGGSLLSNLPLGQFAYPSNGLYTRKGVLLGFYGNGAMENATGKPLMELSNRERIQHVLDQAGKVHPQLHEEFETGFTAFWTHVPFSRGAYASGSRNLLPQLSQPDGRLYLGCAAASEQAAWLEGAISAAWRTVEAVHQRALGE
ncbi:MAG: FAD-dependent oxidoreductase [Gemmatimonadota bacterium]